MAAANGIDRTNVSTFGTADTYVGYFDTPLYRVGTNKNLAKFQEVEVCFVKELASNESFRIQYRINLTDSFTTLRTYTYTALGAVISYNFNILPETDIPPCEYLQLRVYLCGTTTTPQLKQIILR